MPYSFTQIEKDKSMTIGLVFLFLILFYVILLTSLCILLQCFFLSLQHDAIILKWNVLSMNKWLGVLSTGVLSASFHYFFSMARLTARVLLWIRATDPVVTIAKQRMFLNILEEVSAATGGKKFHGVIVPDSSLNAFAVDDGQSLPVIGITEGALYRLNRAQIEAVVAHEAAHILKGDCSRATMVSAMFEVYTIPIKLIMAHKHKDTRLYDGDGGSLDFLNFITRLGPITYVFLSLIAAFYLCTALLSFMMRLFITREAKSRADAIAVRLTRDPVSLAQAIRLLADNWRGAGSTWEAMEGLFFINPVYSTLDEQEGVFFNLFSTHPPIKSRIRILLDMAHCSMEDLEKAVNDQVRQAAEDERLGNMMARYARRWVLQKDGQWLGPFALMEISKLSWVSSQTPVKIWGDDQIKLVQDDEDLKSFALNKLKLQKNSCPVCIKALEAVDYEHQKIMKCTSCQGFLTNEDQAGTIMVRREVTIPEESFVLARRMNSQYVDKNINWQTINHSQHQNGFICPCCQKPMQTRVFNALYTVVIDKCMACGNMWFEAGELEMLQALYEIKTGTR